MALPFQSIFKIDALPNNDDTKDADDANDGNDDDANDAVVVDANDGNVYEANDAVVVDALIFDFSFGFVVQKVLHLFIETSKLERPRLPPSPPFSTNLPSEDFLAAANFFNFRTLVLLPPPSSFFTIEKDDDIFNFEIFFVFAFGSI